MEIIFHNLQHGMTITILVFVMMMSIDYLNVLTKGKMDSIIKGGMFRQYVTASLLGSTPGCLGAFMNISFYVHGLISFGAITGGMIATCGDEAFIMIAMFPGTALLLFVILFFLGIISAGVIDKIIPRLKIQISRECEHFNPHFDVECRCLTLNEIIDNLKHISLTRFLMLTLLAGAFHGYVTGLVGPETWDWLRITFIVILIIAAYIVVTVPDHYLEEHIWKHIAKRHLWKIFLWSFGALLAIDIALTFWNIDTFVKTHMFWVLLFAGLISIIPESGPHLVFVMMFANGLIPFSVLLTSTIVQDGHGMLPLLSYSIKDFLWIKLFNLFIGLSIGFVLYSLGF
ncbi:MAG: putative manganese transporter [Candidatus Anammoxibacter sp.]